MQNRKTRCNGLCCCDEMSGNRTFCHKNSHALLNLLNSGAVSGKILQIMIWYWQVNGSKHQKWVLLLLILFFPQSFKQSLFFCFVNLFHNLKAFLLWTVFKWFWITFPVFHSCMAQGSVIKPCCLKKVCLTTSVSVLIYIFKPLLERRNL